MSTPRTTVLAPARGAIACDAFCSLDDGLCHAVFLSRDGAITDVTYDRGGQTRDVRVIATEPGALDVTAFWSEVNDVRNVITVTASGDAWHYIQDRADGPWSRSLQRNVPGARRVAGYDEHHHGIALTSAGEITDQPFHTVTAAVEQAFRADTAALAGKTAEAARSVLSRPKGEPERPIVVDTVPAAVDIAALWADGPNRFVIVAERSGAITEIGYGIHQGSTRRELARLPGLTSVSACYLGDLGLERRIVALTSAGELYVLRYAIDVPQVGPPLATPRAADVGAFKTSKGELHAVLVAGGEVVDVASPLQI
jgi:hypothetical protein